jgi:arylsulfatase
MKDFFLGKEKKSGRESVIVYMGNDVYGIKWRNWKLHFKELDTWAGVVKEYGVPKLYNLHGDMSERENVFFADAWVSKAASPILVEHAASLKKEPPIKPGTPDPYKPTK